MTKPQNGCGSMVDEMRAARPFPKVLALVFSLVLPLVGCGSGEGAGGASPPGGGPSAAVSDASAPSAEVYRISEQAGEQMPLPAAGVVLAQEVAMENSRAACVVLAFDGSRLGEVRRFPYSKATAGDEPAVSVKGCVQPGTFSDGFSLMAATADYKLPIGRDRHVGAIRPDGAFQDLSGRGTRAVRLENQSEPVFGPGGRLYYWQYVSYRRSASRGIEQNLWSVTSDGRERRREAQWDQERPKSSEEQTFVPAARFAFQNGAPVTDHSQRKIIFGDDGTVLFRGYAGIKVGDDHRTVGRIPNGQTYRITGEVDRIDPVAFTPGDDGTFLGLHSRSEGDLIVRAAIDRATRTLTTTLPDPEPQEALRGKVTSTVVTQDALYYTLFTSAQVSGEDDSVVRLARLPLSGGPATVLAVMDVDPNRRSPVLVGTAS